MHVISVSKREFPNGTTHECLDLKALDVHALALAIPVDRYAEVGLRDVIREADLGEVFNILSSASGEEPENWSRRLKANEEKVRSGSVLSLAEVVRDILRRNDAKPVSFGERRTLDRGLSQLSREVFYSKKLKSVGEAELLIKGAVLAPTVQ